MLQRPKPLPPNGHVAVLAISSPSELSRIREGAAHLEEYGLRVTLAENIDHRHRGYLAGGDDERVAILNRFLRSDEFDGFLFARGGYGAMRILDRIDYPAIAANPRPIIGFSDITALHQAAAIHAGVASFHGPMVNLDFHARLSPEIERWFWSVLTGEAPLTWRFQPSQVVARGEAEGVLFGGCLSLVTSLTGTPYDYWADGGIWFWEDVEEPIYRIDRMLTHLMLSGRLQGIRGVVIGKLKGCGKEEELQAFLSEFFGSLAIPVVRELPFGHQGDNLLLPIGARVRLSTPDNAFTILEPAVRDQQ
ncbi:MAG TPA: LD-carboxypeptidase [Thermoanaerobaculia bacterium]|jgi:muramoyltetrapeptide carboxypeptidase|nr:LD-carboxypeptidase [Thermoanaerobaculia bacterium]